MTRCLGASDGAAACCPTMQQHRPRCCSPHYGLQRRLCKRCAPGQLRCGRRHLHGSTSAPAPPGDPMSHLPVHLGNGNLPRITHPRYTPQLIAWFLVVTPQGQLICLTGPRAQGLIHYTSPTAAVWSPTPALSTTDCTFYHAAITGNRRHRHRHQQ